MYEFTCTINHRFLTKIRARVVSRLFCKIVVYTDKSGYILASKSLIN